MTLFKCNNSTPLTAKAKPKRLLAIQCFFIKYQTPIAVLIAKVTKSWVLKSYLAISSFSGPLPRVNWKQKCSIGMNLDQSFSLAQVPNSKVKISWKTVQQKKTLIKITCHVGQGKNSQHEEVPGEQEVDVVFGEDFKHNVQAE